MVFPVQTLGLLTLQFMWVESGDEPFGHVWHFPVGKMIYSFLLQTSAVQTVLTFWALV